MIQVIHDIITDHILTSFIEYIHRIKSLKKMECKNQFSQKYNDQRLQKCKLDLLLFDILKLFNKFILFFKPIMKNIKVG